jgi:hypothetical protein
MSMVTETRGNMLDPSSGSSILDTFIIWKNMSFCVKIKYTGGELIMNKEFSSDQKTINDIVWVQHV